MLLLLEKQLLMLRMPLLLRRAQHQRRSRRSCSRSSTGTGSSSNSSAADPIWHQWAFFFRHGPLRLDLAPVDRVRLRDDPGRDLRVGEDDEAEAAGPARGTLVGDEGLFWRGRRGKKEKRLREKGEREREVWGSRESLLCPFACLVAASASARERKKNRRQKTT